MAPPRPSERAGRAPGDRAAGSPGPAGCRARLAARRACSSGFPIWWVLGLGALIWPLFAVPMAGRLLTAPADRAGAPRASAAGCSSSSGCCCRSSRSTAATLPFAFALAARQLPLGHRHLPLRLQRAPRTSSRPRRIVRLLAGVLDRHRGRRLARRAACPTAGSPASSSGCCPAGLAEQRVRPAMLVHPSFAQVQDFLGYPLGPAEGAVRLHERLGLGLRAAHPVLHPRLAAGAARPRRRSWRAADPRRLARPGRSSRSTGACGSASASPCVYAATRPGRRWAGWPGGRCSRIVLVGIALIALHAARAVVEGRAENQHSNEGRELPLRRGARAHRQVADHRLRRAAGRTSGDQAPPRPSARRASSGWCWSRRASSAPVFFVDVPGAADLGDPARARRSPSGATSCSSIALVQIFVYDMIPVPLHLIFIVGRARLPRGRGRPRAEPAPATATTEPRASTPPRPTGPDRPGATACDAGAGRLLGPATDGRPRRRPTRRRAGLRRPAHGRPSPLPRAGRLGAGPRPGSASRPSSGARRHARPARAATGAAHRRGPPAAQPPGRSRPATAPTRRCSAGSAPGSTGADLQVAVALGRPRANRKPVLQLIDGDGHARCASARWASTSTPTSWSRSESRLPRRRTAARPAGCVLARACWLTDDLAGPRARSCSATSRPGIDGTGWLDLTAAVVLGDRRPRSRPSATPLVDSPWWTRDRASGSAACRAIEALARLPDRDRAPTCSPSRRPPGRSAPGTATWPRWNAAQRR